MRNYFLTALVIFGSLNVLGQERTDLIKLTDSR
jgi:hypothetical protein